MGVIKDTLTYSSTLSYCVLGIPSIFNPLYICVHVYTGFSLRI